MAKETARGQAARLVLGVTEERRVLFDQIAQGILTQLAPAERAQAQRLTLSTLRNLSRADSVLKPLLRKRPPPPVLALLRVSVTAMLAEGEPPHAVVSEAVGALRAGGRHSEGMAGMANAVLRRAGETAPENWAALPPPILPGWLRGRLMSAYGKVAVIAMEAAHAAGAPLDLTPKDRDAAALAERVGGVALPTGSVRLARAGQISELQGYADGDWWVQDAAAALPAKVLAPRPGERVLDLCSAPGGKTLQLAAAGAKVTALDISAERMERLRENLTRCRLSAEAVIDDALQWQPPDAFDAILLDAPCSATGTIRRHPDLPHVRDKSGLNETVALQAALLDRALTWLRPGGRLVFATCSLLPEEGERQVSAALARHPGLRADRAALALPGVDAGWITAENGLRTRPDLWPERGGMDGFFIAALHISQ
ncbi:Ribosomal RNA small subunit methyltransferase B [Defluviimonas aquaemixtae]|uniref:Ribosomal RNA small subunit methyltransferase B n=1 Tax=Albidovulum aquaemixtae TaxID=1542388 RepID=A0A2R8BMW8_9RHOB|nr:RsmB/NOP family class I SAM-dependent RNA methyltransferase [Defluviimonas aquaemixtae]SPH24784.1 Ribosomal RNA small subunit methyltransferase B [Defluviimonas aquaemixtae]